jgi:hypothetical protein
MLRVWETPESLRTYFQDLAEKYPAEPRWRSGVQAVQQWIYLMEGQAFIRPEEAAGLLRQVAAYAHAGSAWDDFEYHVWAWLRTLPALLQAPACCAYFECLQASQPSAAANYGLQTSAAWLRLLQAGNAAPAEIEALLAGTCLYACASDACFYLNQMLEAWLREQAAVAV